MKHFTDAQFAFKAAVRRAVTMCGGPHAAAELVRVDAAGLSRYGNPECPEFAPIDVCFELDRGAGKPVIFSAWADLGQVDQAAQDLVRLAGEAAMDAGELIQTTIAAASDGTTTINEAKAIDERAADLQDKVVDIGAAARKKMGGEK
jgi:hypothetical protein